MKAIPFAAVAVVSALVAGAEAQFDGSVVLRCAIQTVMACSVTSCVRGTAQTVQLPSVLTVDIGRKLIGGSASGRTARITSTAQGLGKLMISGADIDTLGHLWGLVIEQDRGTMSGAVLKHGDGLLLFGVCTP